MLLFPHRCNRGTQRILSGALWNANPCYSAYILLSGEKNLIICIKEKAPIFLLNTQKRRKREGRFHLLTSFKMDSEYYSWITYAVYYSFIWIQKKEPKETCELGCTGRSATVNTIYAGSMSVPHKEKCQLACYVKSSIKCSVFYIYSESQYPKFIIHVWFKIKESLHDIC